MHANDTRLELLIDWLETDLQLPIESIGPASSDASFRRYFRVRSGDVTRIVMDAPPPRENVRPFVAVAGLLREAGVQTPEIHAVDPERGFVLLGDFGNLNYLDLLTTDSADSLYADAFDALLSIQQRTAPGQVQLPVYDERLLRTELGIFHEWFLGRWLALDLSAGESAMLDDVSSLLIASAIEQPRVVVHRDFHSRNLMVTEHSNPGVLDFQDAVSGPITYDLASLLRDCYIAWPLDRVQGWMEQYRDRLVAAGLLNADDAGRFKRWFDLMGMQRHLKAAGIFARLQIRDGKAGYLKDIPRTLGYVTEVGQNYPELSAFMQFMQARVLPRLAEGLPS